MKKNESACVSPLFLQEFGGLILLDLQYHIVGISAQALHLTAYNTTTFIGISMQTFFHEAFPSIDGKLTKLVKSVVLRDLPLQVISLRYGGRNYYFKCHRQGEMIYLEWEPQLKKYVSASKLNELGFLLERSYPNNWNMICKAVNSFLKYDRVFTIRIFETGQARVIAEDKPGAPAFSMHKEFAETFLPPDLLSYYNRAAYRYIPNLRKREQELYIHDTDFDMHTTQLAAMPFLHEQHLLSHGIVSVIFFPIIINGEFWGMIIGHNTQEKPLDLQNRKLCAFFVQNASSKYESSLGQRILAENTHLKQVEDILKERLYQNKTVNCAMIQSLDILREMTTADGVAIYNEGELYLHGHTPNRQTLHALVNYLGRHTRKAIFKDHNFRLNHRQHFKSKLPFAGILSYRLDEEGSYYILWFREEKQIQLTQVYPRPNKKQNRDAGASTTLHFSEENIHDTAVPWDDKDLNFVYTLREAINTSIIQKVKEKERITEELETANNELEMLTFTLSHDLKNPLSVLHSGLYYLTDKAHTLQAEKLHQWHKNLLNSIDNISDIVNNIVFLSQNKIKTFTKDPIPMNYYIRRIVQESIILHQAQHCQIKYGKLYPIWGEKSALYQIFMNIISNALKYSSSKANPQIFITSALKEDHIHYYITDNGIGIPDRQINAVFDMFNRADNALNHQGSGIGLTLVKRIMDRLGATIKINSDPSGTRVDLFFPLVTSFPVNMMQHL
ncbi:GAF domain-containing sensor histidine kinase [Sphingobacterium psychroaquaticum]|uniref:histidine kinase n=1 Tax=Sphingobacterium psychroaquaticum TaxID=561061 RepID=A0A1X7JM61_9SPHI|nr:ATP-binding protein [Sphingobacterium psychroaquaticum]SMG29052.1 Bacteriophytochrome (light-regulated signal transduction histidine kinase) [Sphingobacterium psychroaquaticum]